MRMITCMQILGVGLMFAVCTVGDFIEIDIIKSDGYKLNRNSLPKVFSPDLTTRDTKHATKTKIVCYYMVPRALYNSTLPAGLNSTLCSHVIFLRSDIIDCKMDVSSPYDAHLFKSAIPVMKQQNPTLKVLISSTNYKQYSFDETLKSQENRQKFIRSSLPFLREYGFDGLDMDWEFPGWGSKPVIQRKNYTLLLQGLRQAFDKEALLMKDNSLLLTAAVSASDEMMVIYDIPVMAKVLDFVNVMGYDYSGYSGSHPYTDYNSPLFAEVSPKLTWKMDNLNWSANAWVREGMPKEKVMVGTATYSRAFKLRFPSMDHKRLAWASSAGDCNAAAYVCTCRAKKKYNGTVVWDDVAKVPYMYYKDQWITYDSERSLSTKAKWVMENGFGGIMVFSLHSDDYAGECDGKTKFPLISAIHKTIHG